MITQLYIAFQNIVEFLASSWHYGPILCKPGQAFQRVLPCTIAVFVDSLYETT